MKKTCSGCSALGYASGLYCSLAFLTKEISTGKLAPKEDCPKPKTNKEYLIEYEKFKDRHR
jgi:hypothetical protein